MIRVFMKSLSALLLLPLMALAEQTCIESGLQATTPTERFEIKDEVVIDKQTSLMWRRCFEGTSGPNCEGEALELSWPSAFKRAEQVNAEGKYGFADWRVPNIRELTTLVEARCSRPALNPELFPSAPSMRVWSSSPYRLYPHYSWFLDFSDANTENVERFNRYGVLLVRTIE